MFSVPLYVFTDFLTTKGFESQPDCLTHISWVKGDMHLSVCVIGETLTLLEILTHLDRIQLPEEKLLKDFLLYCEKNLKQKTA